MHAPEIYLDNNATTRILPEVAEAMEQAWRDGFANPGSRHATGRRARQTLEAARESMAAILGADPDEIIFTSGGTESNNMALLGFTQATPGTIALTAGEHPAVMETAKHLQQFGWKLRILPVDREGRLTSPPLNKGGQGGSRGNVLSDDSRTESDARRSCNESELVGRPTPPDPPLLRGGDVVSVILAHNETGVVQDLTTLAAMCREARVPLHVDAVQAVGKIPVNFHALGCASLALGAHKFHGPRGVGALLLRRGWNLAPSAFGGHQEAGRRPGTECVPLIAGMARALEIFHADCSARMTRLANLRNKLERGLIERSSPAIVNGSHEHRLPNTLNIAFPGVDGEALLVSLDLEGIACSLGSTCASGSAEPAPVLMAMNAPPEVLHSSVRFSLGVENTEDEIDDAILTIAAVVQRLRASSPSP